MFSLFPLHFLLISLTLKKPNECTDMCSSGYYMWANAGIFPVMCLHVACFFLPSMCLHLCVLFSPLICVSCVGNYILLLYGARQMMLNSVQWWQSRYGHLYFSLKLQLALNIVKKSSFTLHTSHCTDSNQEHVNMC